MKSNDKKLYYEVKVIKVINWPLLHKAIEKKFNRRYDRLYVDHVWKGMLPSRKLKEFLDQCLGKPLEK